MHEIGRGIQAQHEQAALMRMQGTEQCIDGRLRRRRGFDLTERAAQGSTGPRPLDQELGGQTFLGSRRIDAAAQRVVSHLGVPELRKWPQ